MRSIRPRRVAAVLLVLLCALPLAGTRAHAASGPPRYLSTSQTVATLTQITAMERGCYVGEEAMIAAAARSVSSETTNHAARANSALCARAADDFVYGRDYLSVNNLAILAHLYDVERAQAQAAMVVDSDVTNYIRFERAGMDGRLFADSMRGDGARLGRQHGILHGLLLTFIRTRHVN